MGVGEGGWGTVNSRTRLGCGGHGSITERTTSNSMFEARRWEKGADAEGAGDHTTDRNLLVVVMASVDPDATLV